MFKQKAEKEAWFGFVAFSFKVGLKMCTLWAYSRRFGSRLFATGAFLNLIVTERMNYGRYKIFTYSLIFFF